MLDNEFRLTDIFPPIPAERWREAVERDLGGASFERRLVTPTVEGVTYQPLYTVADRPGGEPRPAQPRGWELRQDHLHPDPRRVAETVREDLDGGVDSIILRLDPTGEKGLLGVSVDALDAALAHVDLAQVPVAVEGGPHYAAVAAMMSELRARRGTPDAAARGSHLADPLGALAGKGKLPVPLDVLLGELGELAARSASETPGVTTAKVSTCPAHNSGAGADLELAIALSSGLSYLKAMTDAGLTLDEASAQVQICMSTGATFFLDIAKLRAARVLWARLMQAAGGSDEPVRLHARTSVRMLTRRDPWVNILRSTTGAFAAAVGGADIVTVTPFDHLLGPTGRLGRRIARNIPIILEQESHLGRVADPAAGSWFVESLTDELCERGWALFQEIEGRGGMAAVLADGWLKERVDEVAAQRDRAAAKRKAPVTGVSEFPNLGETLPEAVAPDLDALRAEWNAPGALARPGGEPMTVAAFPERRPAAAFEVLRDASDARLRDTGARPRAFLAALGPVAVHTARSGWSRNMLEAGGLEALPSGGSDGPDQAAAAFRDSGAGIAVICSSDDVYAEQAAATARALKAAGAAAVVLAGRPGDREAEWREAGVDHFIHVGCDVLDVLRTLLRTEGVEA